MAGPRLCAIEEAANAASVVCGDWFCRALAIADVALMPAIVVATAVAAWRVQRTVLARRTAWDYISDRELEEDWQKLSQKALRLLADKKERADWEEFAAQWSLSKLSDDDVEETAPIFRWLARREFVAVGLLNGTVHMPTYAEWWGVEFIHEWKRAEGFVAALRATGRGDDDLFSKFEEAATSERFRQLAKWEELVGD